MRIDTENFSTHTITLKHPDIPITIKRFSTSKGYEAVELSYPMDKDKITFTAEHDPKYIKKVLLAIADLVTHLAEMPSPFSS